VLPPPTHTPLVALPAVVLDLETTGLDVRADRMIQVAALFMHGEDREDGLALESLVNPGVPIPERSTAIHHIVDADVANAPDFAAIAPQLQKLLSGRVVIGHNIGFDVAILRYEFARAGLPWREPPMIDIGQLLGALQPALPDIGLESVASTLGIRIEHRHSAAGDCQAAAEAWARLLPILREREIRTLGEAQSLANERQDLVMHQARAGWFGVPGELVAAPPMPPAPRIDCYVFARSLADVMSAPPTLVPAQTTLREAARTMTGRGIGALLIGEADGVPRGIVTERDLLRATAQAELDFDTAQVEQIMSRSVESMRSGELIYRALGRMDRAGVRHLCVVDESGVAVGMVSQRDLLQHRARGQDMLNDALAAAGDARSLAAAYAQVTSVASRLLAEDLDGADIARIISAELQGLTSRAAQLCMEAMDSPAPAPWCVLVLGSGGRGESLLGADQDNALIHTGTAADDPWFADFGARLADLLDLAGVPRCKGDVMVSSSKWRGSEQDWKQRVTDWLRRANPADILNVDIFFDLVPVAGEAGLARRLHDDAVRSASRAPAFLGLLAQSVRAIAPRMGMFRNLRVENGRVNLKRDGLLSLVCLARTLALRAGSRSRGTPERLRDVVAAGRLAQGDADRLIALHALLLTLILRQQLQDIEDGVPISSSVAVKQLSRPQLAQLKSGLHHLDTIVHEAQSLIAS